MRKKAPEYFDLATGSEAQVLWMSMVLPKWAPSSRCGDEFSFATKFLGEICISSHLPEALLPEEHRDTRRCKFAKVSYQSSQFSFVKDMQMSHFVAFRMFTASFRAQDTNGDKTI